MSYSEVCPECGLHSGSGDETCPGCGAKKALNIEKSEPSEVVYDKIDSEFRLFEKPSLYIKILISLIILLGGIFFLPDFLRNSEMFWILYSVSNVFTVIKAVDAHFAKLHGIYPLSKIFLCVYIGAGIGNVIEYSGKNSHFFFSYYFNPAFLYSQLRDGNKSIFFGAAAGAGFYFLIDYLKNVLNES
ncbi:MAG TPA: hypothetical protein VMT35_18860 [Ignavibacteriaceae bacterium]|nr:hypothetical protein [Ignavibacteriaceae bacterium]